MSSRFPLAAGLLIVSGFGARTWARNRDWRDELTFWSIAVQTSPLSFKTHTILAETLHAEHRDPDQAIREDEQSLALLSSLPDRLSDPGVYLRLAAEYTEKADALRSQPPNAQVRIPAERVSLYERARTLLFRRLAILREIRRAERTASPVLPGERGDPRLLDHAAEMFTYLMLSATDQQEGLIDESILSARQAQAAGPMSTFVYLRLHELLTAAGRREEARSAVMEGLLLTSDPELEKALLADYATTPDRNQCAISYAAVMPEIDFSCASVRRLACEVSEAALQSARNAGLPDVEMRLKRDFRVKYACDSRH